MGSRALRKALVAVVAADIDPSQSIGRPHSAPAAVIVGVVVGRANEGNAMEAVMEEVAPAVERDSRKSGRESSMRKMRARETAAAEVCGSKARAAAHAA